MPRATLGWSLLISHPVKMVPHCLRSRLLMVRRYDDMKTAQENIELQTTILSRFDLIFIVKDERSLERDKMIARHVLNVHKMAGALLEVDEEEQKVLPVNYHTINSNCLIHLRTDQIHWPMLRISQT